MTTDTLTPRLQTLLHTLSNAELTRLARRIAADLQSANAGRIAAQQQPDGTPFTPRQPQPARYRTAQGKIRQALFTRLRDKQHLRIRSATPQLIEIGFAPRDEHIARIHHYGLIDQVNPHLRIRYPIRQLLGLTEADKTTLSHTVMDYLTKT